MPAFDQTGPRGMGPLTGRGMGPCARGRGMGFGRGRGLGRFFGGNQAWSKKDLEDYKKALIEEMEDVDKELSKADEK